MEICFVLHHGVVSPVIGIAVYHPIIILCVPIVSQPTRTRQYYHWSHDTAGVGSDKQLQAHWVARFQHDLLHQIHSYQSSGSVECLRDDTL